MTKRDVIFVWIPKNAGSTVFATCKSSLGMFKQKFPPQTQISTGNYTFGHQSLSLLVSNGYISESYVDQAFKFAVSRCPYERAVSLYCYHKNVSLSRLSSRFSRSPTFLEYLQSLNNHGFMPLGLGKLHWRQASNPQSKWLQEFDLDQIIPMAMLERSLQQIIQQYSSFSIDLITKNVNNHSSWQDFYCKESKQLVEYLYEEDFFDFPFLNFGVPQKRSSLLPDELELSHRLGPKIFGRIFRSN